MVQMEGSDLHITTATPPQVRVHGHLVRLSGADMNPSETKQLAYSVLTDAQKKRFEETLELDFSFGIKGLARFRVQHVQSARRGRRGLPVDSREDPQLPGAEPAAGARRRSPSGRAVWCW